MSENPQNFTQKTLTTIGKDSLTINEIASIVGVPSMFLAAPVAREMNKLERSYYPAQRNDLLLNSIGDFNQLSPSACREVVTRLDIIEATRETSLFFSSSEKWCHDCDDCSK